MNVTAASLLTAAMRRFDEAAINTVRSATQLSEPSLNAGDLAGDLINLSTAGNTVKAVAATASVESELQQSVLNIVA